MRSRIVGSIIRREYLERVRSREFIITTVAVPILMALSVALPVAMIAGAMDVEPRLAVVDETGTLAEGLQSRLDEGGYQVEIAAPGDTTLDARIRRGELFGYLVVDGRTIQEGRAEFRSEAPIGPIRRAGIQSILAQTVMSERLGGTGEGQEVWNLLSGEGLEVSVVDQEMADANMSSARKAMGFLGAFILYGVILLYGQMVRRSVQEEKTNRIVEILLCSVRPGELMLGKIVGVGAVGLTQVLVWVGAGAMVVLLGLPLLITMVPQAVEVQEALRLLPGLGLWLFFLANFLLGYFLFASLFAASGALATGDEETNHADLPLMVLTMTPFIFMVATQEQPDTLLTMLMSLVPFFSPVLMFNRAVQGLAAPWEAGLSLVLMALTLLAVAWLAGRIYRVGILMQGKRVTLPELRRWIWEAD